MLPAWEPADLPADAVEVGRILNAWGVKGWFKVSPHSASPQALFSSKRWYLQASDRPNAPFQGTVLMRIRDAKEHGDALVACAQETIDRDTAENLKGSRIFIPRSSFPCTQTDEYYWVDLIGLSVQNRDAQPLGVVTDLVPTGPHAVLVIQAPNPVEPTQPLERLIPFVNAYVDKVDLEARTVWVDWPLGHD